MIALVKLRARSSFCIGGDRVVHPGEVFSIDAASASEMLAVGRAELLNEGDRTVINAAVAGDVKRTLAAAGPLQLLEGPWRRFA